MEAAQPQPPQAPAKAGKRPGDGHHRTRRGSHRKRRHLRAFLYTMGASMVVTAILALTLFEPRSPPVPEVASAAPGAGPAPHPAAQPVRRAGDAGASSTSNIVICPADPPATLTLPLAAACGRNELLPALLGNNANVDEPDPRPFFKGRTALHHATQRGDDSMVRMLLAAGASPGLADAQGNTPLHLLAMAHFLPFGEYIARRLIDAGASIDARNHAGLTPIEALEASHHALLERQGLAKLLFRVQREAEFEQWLGRGPRMPEGAVEAGEPLVADIDSGEVRLAPRPDEEAQGDEAVQARPATPASPAESANLHEDGDAPMISPR
jgi:ankyrin repeat protein